ncbi:ATP-binding protein [Piscinibacter sakaiensis]|uniref:PAS domain-containing sensor histidine kinase n=1 Tax=Piscinibacter sakaiensis TaxID=1547922 RepID=UPI003AABA1C1
MADGSTESGYEALYEHAACGLMVTDDDGRISRVNATLCHWLDYRPEQLVGQRKLQDLLTMGGRIFHQTHWAPLLQIQGSIAEVKFELIHRDGHAMPAIMNAVRRGTAPTIRHEIAMFIAEDRHRYEREFIAARKRAEALLASEREAQRQLSAAQQELERQRAVAEDRAAFAEQMIGIVSHDLRNPLMAIQTSATLLGAGELGRAQRRAADAIGRAVTRSNRLIQDLLDLTRARIGNGLRIYATEIDLHQVVAAAVDELRLAHPNRTVDHRTSGSGRCKADADRLAQLVGNLVTNALNYGDAFAPVTVTSGGDGDLCELLVHNTGKPIPAEQLPTLFDAMTRGSGSGGASPQSVGLGLFIVREIARAHAGKVTVASSASEGTTFVVTLPARAPDGDD